MSNVLQTIILENEDKKDTNLQTHLQDNAIDIAKTKKETENVSDSFQSENGVPWIQDKKSRQTKLFEVL